MTGSEIYEIAIDMVDEYNRRFCDMVDTDSRQKVLDRKYFAPDIDWICGWARFRKNMIDAGDSEWLRRIENLDEQKMIEITERGLLDVLSSGKEIDKAELDNYVKSIQAMANRSKIISDNKENTEGDLPLIKVEFMPMKSEPVEIVDVGQSNKDS